MSTRFITAGRFPLVATAALVMAAAACGGGGGEEDSSPAPVLTPTTAQIVPVIVSSDLAVGPNRFVLGLIDQSQNAEVLGAQLHFRFFKLDGDQSILKVEADPTAIRVTKSYTEMREDGTAEIREVGETGVYIANVEFDSAGDWAVEVSGTVDGQPLEPLMPAFPVREQSLTVAVGDPAPRSVQTTLSDVADITEIDTSDPPNPDMHSMTIAEAVTSGKPTVIAFATPAFCTSRICGPTKQVVDRLYENYKGQANFIHVEPYDLEKARNGQGLQVLPFLEEEWGLRTEPWVFLVDKEGNIAAKFEALASYEELEATLSPFLSAAGSGHGY